MSLKDGKGLVVGKGILLAEVHTGDDVARLILFPHQVRIEEVYGSGHEKQNEDGQLLRECIRQTVRWSRNAIHMIDNVALNTTRNIPMIEEFNFEKRLYMDRSRFDKRNQSVHEHVGGEKSSVEINGTGVRACATFSVSGVDGLTSGIPKRKYCTTKRVAKGKGERRIGLARAQKVALANVERDLKCSLCSRRCLKKLNVRVILMKRLKAWGSEKYEERASWILENLTEYYNEENDKFETKLCGQSVCNGCYAMALGYSKRHIEELKSDIRSTGIISEVFDVQCKGRSSVVYGNTIRVPQNGLGMQAMESIFQKYVQNSGCTQPHRHCQRRNDKTMVPLVLLPMNTRREDVFHAVIADVEKITMSKARGPCSFYRMWCMRYTHIQIPPHSRFSKCQICWEYRTCFEASNTNPTQKQLIREQLNLYQALQVEERRDYWNAKSNTILYLNESMCLIVDGMDQNTTMVPKLRQAVKGIEGRYVKTHLCGVLVHGEGLYSDVWIDSHHKHDSNQIVTSIMNVIDDVRTRRGGKLPPMLSIQANNCGRENKNQYIFVFCTVLVGLRYFAKVYLSFFLVEHTHEDIDQRFSIISGTLKHQDIDSLQELLELIKKRASHTEAFAASRHLEYVWDWKEFITPYLYSGLNAFVGISTKHHFKFYLKENKLLVQTKDYACDPIWEPVDGYQCLSEVPNHGLKPNFAQVHDANDQELKALEDFIIMKEKCIMKLMYVEHNLHAIEDTKWLLQYLKEFPRKDKLIRWEQSQFWPDTREVNAQASMEWHGMALEGPPPLQSNANTFETGSTVLDHLPPILQRGYFGPRQGKP